MHEIASRVHSKDNPMIGKNFVGPLVTYFSSVLGKKFPSTIISPQYWRANFESPVLLHEAVSGMMTAMHPGLLVETRPHRALMAPLRQTSEAMSSDCNPHSDNVVDLPLLAGIFSIKGYCVDLGQVNEVGQQIPRNHGLERQSLTCRITYGTIQTRSSCMRTVTRKSGVCVCTLAMVFRVAGYPEVPEKSPYGEMCCGARI